MKQESENISERAEKITVKPECLKQGDTVMLISPASGLAGIIPHRFENGKIALEKMGFRVIKGRHAHLTTGDTAGTVVQRVEDIHDGVKDSRVKALISIIGGKNVSYQILPCLNWDLLINNPKIFVGYSDATQLLLGIHKMTGLVVFYGPSVMTQFGEYQEIFSYTKKYFEKALCSTKPVGKIKPSSHWTDEFLDWQKKLDLTRPRSMCLSEGWEWLQRGRTQGKLLGGCIQSLSAMADTAIKYLPDFTDSLFFWESAEKNVSNGVPPEEIKRDLQKMKDLGIFQKMKGMVVGRPYKYTRQWHKELKMIIKDVVNDPIKPILYNVEIGHTDPILTIPIGVGATIDSEKNLFSIDEAGVK